MNEDGNTLKTGLIEATTITVVDILNTTFPRVENAARRKRARRHLELSLSNDAHLAKRDLLHLESSLSFSASSLAATRRNRNLVYYTEEYPVTINRIIDMDATCDPGDNCLLIISTITVVPEPGDDPDAISSGILSGFNAAAEDGTLLGNIPEDTVICPSRRRKLGVNSPFRSEQVSLRKVVISH